MKTVTELKIIRKKKPCFINTISNITGANIICKNEIINISPLTMGAKK
jgi:hypothetical protein